MDLDSPPVQRLRVCPPEVLVEEGLLASTVHQVLSPNDVGYSLIVVIDGALEVQKRPNLVLVTLYSGVGRIQYSQGRPVTQSRVGQGHGCLHSDHSITLRNFARIHRLPVRQGVGDPSIPTRAVFHFLAQPPEILYAAAAHVSETTRDHLLGTLEVAAHVVTGSDDDVGSPPCKPFVLTLYPVISINDWRLDLGVCVIKP